LLFVLICCKNISFGYASCEPDPIFVPVSYRVPEYLSFVLPAVIHVAPIQLIGLVLAVFAAMISPFGGFIASGFKRAYKIKVLAPFSGVDLEQDFGDSIPGHGGVMDRMDCQILMGVFVYVFMASFIDSADMNANDVIRASRA